MKGKSSSLRGVCLSEAIDIDKIRGRPGIEGLANERERERDRRNRPERRTSDKWPEQVANSRRRQSGTRGTEHVLRAARRLG